MTHKALLGDPTDEEKALMSVIRAAREVQTFLWGEADLSWGIEEWLRMFRKRVVKLEEIDRKNPHAKVEMKKRLLQTAALSVALIAIIDKHGINWEGTGETPSNLPQYSEPVRENDKERCSGCGMEIDASVCWCGEEEAAHNATSDHMFIPLGCKCYQAAGE